MVNRSRWWLLHINNWMIWGDLALSCIRSSRINMASRWGEERGLSCLWADPGESGPQGSKAIEDGLPAWALTVDKFSEVTGAAVFASEWDGSVASRWFSHSGKVPRSACCPVPKSADPRLSPWQTQMKTVDFFFEPILLMLYSIFLLHAVTMSLVLNTNLTTSTGIKQRPSQMLLRLQGRKQLMHGLNDRCVVK